MKKTFRQKAKMSFSVLLCTALCMSGGGSDALGIRVRGAR